MAQTMNLSLQKQALSSAALMRPVCVQKPFQARQRTVAASAHKGPSDAFMKVVGAVAAAQIALLPLADAAFAANPLAPNPAEVLQQKTKQAQNAAKGVANKAGIPDPVKAAAQKTKEASKSLSVTNPAVEFARKAEKNVKKVSNNTAPTVNKAKSAVSNPAREFALKAEQAKKKVGLPLGTIGLYGNLQQDVLFGFGEKKVEQKVDQAKGAVEGAAKDAADKADKATPDSFSIFDASSVSDARQQLKANLDKAVNTKSDPAEQVVSVGKPGETQEDNAERIRREAENGAVEGGDARAPTN